MNIERLGRVTYEAGLTLQREARDRVLAGGEDVLLLLEHEPVVTLGRRGGQWDRAALAALDTPVVETDRGGLATWHGPGQLVGYPIVDLRRARRDVPGFVRLLGESLARLVRDLGVPGAAYDDSRPGVYVEGRKLSSLGLHIHRGVTTHGFSLNVANELAGFAAIVSCGCVGLEVTTVSREAGRAVTLKEAEDAVIAWASSLSTSRGSGDEERRHARGLGLAEEIPVEVPEEVPVEVPKEVPVEVPS